MQIDLDLLFTWGAIAKEYKKGEMIFGEDETANFYFQIIEAIIKFALLNSSYFLELASPFRHVIN